jgi:hypothetical protein
MKITITTTEPNRHARAVFSWSDDCAECSIASFGFTDAEIDALITAKAHEGADAPGVSVEVSA